MAGKMQGLANDSDALFDEHSFSNMSNAQQANQALRWFSAQASKFHTDLIRRDYTPDQINMWMNTLWSRIIKACDKFGVPLNETAEAQKKRLGL